MISIEVGASAAVDGFVVRWIPILHVQSSEQNDFEKATPLESSWVLGVNAMTDHVNQLCLIDFKPIKELASRCQKSRVEYT